MHVTWHAGLAAQAGSEIIWDDIDSSDRKMSATAFMSSMSYLKVRVGRLQMHGKGLLAKLACKRHALTGGGRWGRVMVGRVLCWCAVLVCCAGVLAGVYGWC
jgi:hypothetical protein